MHKASSFQVSLDLAAGCPLRPKGKKETSLYAILQRRPLQILAWEQLWYSTTDAMLVFFNSSHSTPFSKVLMNSIRVKKKLVKGQYLSEDKTLVTNLSNALFYRVCITHSKLLHNFNY